MEKRINCFSKVCIAALLALFVSFCNCTRVHETGVIDEENNISKQDTVYYSVELIDSILIKKNNEIEKLYRLQQIYTSQVGVREATNRNDGPEIEMYLRSVGLNGRYAWCAAFVRWAHDSAGYVTTINGLASSAHRPDNLVFFRNKFQKEPQPGDVFCLWFPNLKRIGHTGFWDRAINESIYETVEGNTNGSGGREGDGVYRIKRSYNSTYSISRWTSNEKE